MDAFVWDDRYMTGETLVDSEHRQLVAIINEIIELTSKYETAEEITSVLDRLVQYAVVHFAHEEELMATCACDPRFAARHVAVHKNFAEQVTRMREAPGGGVDLESLLRFLTSWLAYHILGMDKAMARQIHRIHAGVTPAEAFAAEEQLAADPATSSMLDAMNSLYRIISARNDALSELNQSLESQVEARTRALSASNHQLLAEQQRLREAMQQLEVTQKRLLESEHRRAEESKRNLRLFLAQIIDGDPVPTFVIDHEHRVTHWNKACAVISGLSAEQMVGGCEQWRAFYPSARPTLADLIVDGSLPQDLGAYYGDALRRSSAIADAFESEGFFPELGNGGRWLAFTAAPLRDASERIIGAIETLQDVTERHRAQDELLRYQGHLEEQVAKRTHELAEANHRLEREQQELTALLARVEEAQQQLLQSEKMAAIGQLAAGVAHEINNPIGFVHSNLGTLKNYIDNLLGLLDIYEEQGAVSPDPRLQAARSKADLDFMREDLPLLLKESQDGLERVTRIVQDLKDFSRVDQAERQLADLNECLRSTLNVARNEIKYKAEVVLELADLPAVDCVPAQINQVFMNIVVNAAQAIEQHGRILVRSSVERDLVRFDIEDNGPGMPAEVKKRIFEPFFTTKPVGKGTGLGLSISYDIIVKRHRGHIEVDSRPGVGTRFSIWLPIRSPEETPVS